MTGVFDALVLLTNFVLLPGLTYGSQLALGALGVTLIYGILRFGAGSIIIRGVAQLG